MHHDANSFWKACFNAAVILLCIASPSSAGIITVTASGVVGSDGYDANGVFGAPGSSLFLFFSRCI
jgi:hypothetical protein